MNAKRHAYDWSACDFERAIASHSVLLCVLFYQFKMLFHSFISWDGFLFMSCLSFFFLLFCRMHIESDSFLIPFIIRHIFFSVVFMSIFAFRLAYILILSKNLYIWDLKTDGKTWGLNIDFHFDFTHFCVLFWFIWSCFLDSAEKRWSIEFHSLFDFQHGSKSAHSYVQPFLIYQQVCVPVYQDHLQITERTICNWWMSDCVYNTRADKRQYSIFSGKLWFVLITVFVNEQVKKIHFSIIDSWNVRAFHKIHRYVSYWLRTVWKSVTYLFFSLLAVNRAA